jgi:hypothetical protein
MSYIVYINGNEIDVDNKKPISYNKQVNSLARLDNRQTSYSNTFTAPLIAKNLLAMQNVYLVGNNSNLPYQRNRIDVIDADTCLHLILNGIANVKLTQDKGYEIYTYDGIIDFYRAIENITLSECGISELNHLKNIENIVDSWENDLNYKYIIADYNGKKLTDDFKLNADYLIPSVKNSYLWERVHTYAGYTYSGEVFNTEAFINFYMTFPKPIGQTPEAIDVVTQTSEIDLIQLPFPLSNQQTTRLFSEVFSNTYASGDGVSTITILEAGTYKLDISGFFFRYSSDFVNQVKYNQVKYRVVNSLNQTLEEGIVNSETTQGLTFTIPTGGKIILTMVSTGVAGFYPIYGMVLDVNLFGEITTEITKLNGFVVDFEESLIDFGAKDYINEIIQHFGLTAIKEVNRNHITYLKLNEVLENPNILDWSDKFIDKKKEGYQLGNYAKKNNFVYRYNDDGANYNDGFITINDFNLKDEFNIIQSKIYTPEKFKSTLLSRDMNVYKIWNKEVKDDLSISYKDLSGRFYFLRFENIDFNGLFALKSEVLDDEAIIEIAPVESYFRLKFNQIIADNYLTIGAILNKSKLLNVDFWLKPIDVIQFDFKKLIYVEQLQSYYLVNKIPNFIKGKPTTLELIEVDYFTQIENPDVNSEITIEDITISSCMATIDVNTNITQPSDVVVIVYISVADGFGGFVNTQFLEIPATMSGNSVSVSIEDLPYNINGYAFAVRYATSVFETITSAISNYIVLDGTCYVAPVYPTTLVLNSVLNLGTTTNPMPYMGDITTYNCDYSYTGIPSGIDYELIVDGFSIIYGIWLPLGTFTKTQGAVNELTQIVSGYAISKIRLRILAVTSNEIIV